MELKHRQILSAQVDLSKFNKANFEKATDEEKKQQDVMGESTTFFKDGMTPAQESACHGKYHRTGIDSSDHHHRTAYMSLQVFRDYLGQRCA